MREAEGTGEGREWVLKLHGGNRWFALLPVGPVTTCDRKAELTTLVFFFVWHLTVSLVLPRDGLEELAIAVSDKVLQ